jgi:hypothetical protein
MLEYFLINLLKQVGHRRMDLSQQQYNFDKPVNFVFKKV